MVRLNTIVSIRLVFATHIFTRLEGIPSREAVDLAANPAVEAGEIDAFDGQMDWLWLCINAGSRGSYRFGYNASSLYPSNLKCIQRMNSISSKWELYWKDTE